MMPLTPEEAKTIEIIRRYTSDYADFRVEMREKKIVRVLPTFSELVKIPRNMV